MPKNSSKKPYLVPGPKARLRQGTFEKPRQSSRRGHRFRNCSIFLWKFLRSVPWRAVINSDLRSAIPYYNKLLTPRPLGVLQNTMRHKNITYPKKILPELFLKLPLPDWSSNMPDTLCICVSCMTLPA